MAILHLRCGDDLRTSLPKAQVPGRYQSFVDPICQGPLPAVDGEAYLRARADFLTAYGGPAITHYARLRSEYNALRGYVRHQELVIWAEHDMYDQLNLVRLLDWFAPRNLKHVRLSLVQAGDYLGLTKPAQLRSLFAGRQQVSTVQLGLGRLAWQALRSRGPNAVEKLLLRDLSALPYLGSALKRHLAEFPAVDNGLSLTELNILKAVEGGAETLGSILSAQEELEAAVWAGDIMLWAVAERLAAGGALTIADARVALTTLGRDLLAGKADWVQVAGLDRWVGGVRLEGRQTAWRWTGRALQS